MMLWVLETCAGTMRRSEGSADRTLERFCYWIKTDVNVERYSHLAELLVFGPQECRRRKKNGGDQVCVGQADAQTVQAARFDHGPHLTKLRLPHSRQKIE